MSRNDDAAVWARTCRRGAALTALFLTLTGAGAHAAGSETLDGTFPASVTPAGVFATTGTYGLSPSISDDGRYVAFASTSANLGGDGPPGIGEVYVKDLNSGAIELVSRASGAHGAAADAPAGEGIEKGILSGNGRYVIFTSDADDLASGLPGEEAEERHVYRRDLQTAETQVVDRVTGPQGAILDREARAEAISDDGRYVVFSDHVSDLEDSSGTHEGSERVVYVRDMNTGTTTLVSRADGANGASADARSSARSISPDGRYVAFVSEADNLLTGEQPAAFPQAYLRDLTLHRTTLVSRSAASAGAPNGEPGDEPSLEAILVSSDGCKVAFESAATNLYPGATSSAPQVYLRDLCSTPQTTTLVSRADGEAGAAAGASNPETPPYPLGATADGTQILFSAAVEGLVSGAGDLEHLYLRNLATGHTTVLDRADAAQGALANRELANGGFEAAAISANGCRASFATPATNLGGAPPNENIPEVYVRQLASCRPPAEEPSTSEEHNEETTQADPGTPQPGTGDGSTGAGPQNSGNGPSVTAPIPTPERVGTAPPVRLNIESLSSARLLLAMPSGAKAVVKIARRVGHGSRRHWRTVRTLTLHARKAGALRVRLPHLSPGRYRVSVEGTGGRHLLRNLEIPDGKR
jgi:Tol biopolymer transport system component